MGKKVQTIGRVDDAETALNSMMGFLQIYLYLLTILGVLMEVRQKSDR